LYDMPGAARLGDKAQVAQDSHGCPACPHPGVGPIVTGSPDVNINGLPAGRVDDLGVHAACCGSNTFVVKKGSSTVYVNGKPLARMQDKTQHCGGSGPIIDGSGDVLIDDGAGAASTLSSKVLQALRVALAQALEFAHDPTPGESGDNPGRGKGAGGPGASLASDGAAGAPAFRAIDGDDAPAFKPKGPGPGGEENGAAPAGAQTQAAAAPGLAWLEVDLVDPDGKPAGGYDYLITFEGGETREGTVDASGTLRLEGVPEGTFGLRLRARPAPGTGTTDTDPGSGGGAADKPGETGTTDTDPGPVGGFEKPAPDKAAPAIPTEQTGSVDVDPGPVADAPAGSEDHDG
jgi:uncharacterized Zn-binding protein involved in type VI secretion